MTEQRFRRDGAGWRFAPDEVRAVLHFTLLEKTTYEVVVLRRDGKRAFTRRVDILTSPLRGNLKELLEELNKWAPADWGTLLREACESVNEHQRLGRPFQVVQGAIVRPPAPPWLCQGLLLKDKPNVWFGAGSTGKSTLAKAICAYYAAGYRFLDRPMEQGVPLYLDWEDDYEGFQRTVFDVCRNLGVWPLPRMIWRDMHGTRLRDQIQGISDTVDREHVGLLVLDAVAAASGSPGEHMSWESVALELEMALGSLPPVTVLALDHVTAADHTTGIVPTKARGAERKYEFARNQWALIGDREAAAYGRHLITWNHTKLNVAALEPPFVTEVIHREAEISIVLRALDASDEAMERLSQSDRAVRLVMKRGGLRARDVCLELDGQEPSKTRLETIRTALERAMRKGILHKDASDRYSVKVTADGVVIPFPGGAA